MKHMRTLELWSTFADLSYEAHAHTDPVMNRSFEFRLCHEANRFCRFDESFYMLFCLILEASRFCFSVKYIDISFKETKI